jgi:hypothetical protein
MRRRSGSLLEACRLSCGPIALVGANGLLTLPATVMGGFESGAWHLKFGLCGPLSGVLLFQQPVGLFESAAVATMMTSWVLYAFRPKTEMLGLLLGCAVLWNLVGWSAQV